MTGSAPTFPFSAVVAMDDLRLALVLNAVSPAIGGVLVRGEKGTAKSTAVRALSAVLPPVEVLTGCRFSCAPTEPDPGCPDGPHAADTAALRRPSRLVELPVGATDDRLTGSLDVQRALTEGVTSFQPGLLAAAHRGVLYVDEVNLLHDHLVDLLLDAAALGTSYVERDGVSVRHAARFLLVGTMNPEEGELRPQLLDRFGLTVEAAAPREPATRAEVVRRRLAFDADPDGFTARFAADEAGLAVAIGAARDRLAAVRIDGAALDRIAAVCTAFAVDGLRADIVIARTAAAHAAWRGDIVITREDIRVAARLALPHRRRRNPFDAPGLDEQQLEDALGPDDPEPPDGGPDPEGDSAPEPEDGSAPQPETGSGPESESDSGSAPGSNGAPPAGAPAPTGAGVDGAAGDPAEGTAEASQDSAGQNGAGQGGAAQGAGAGSDGETDAATPVGTVAASGTPFRARRLEVPGRGHGAGGRRSRAYTDSGRTIGARPPQGPLHDLHPVATLVAGAPHQTARGRTGAGLLLRAEDLRARRREGRESNLVLFAVDASGSMGARRRMESVKGAVLSLLLDAYQRRDKVGLIAFRGRGADLLLPPTSSVDAAAARLATLPTGGRTPLRAGLTEAHATLCRERLRDPDRRALLVLVTDGRHTAGGDPTAAAGLLHRDGFAAVVVDCESGPVRLGLAAALARTLDAECLRPDQLSASGLTGAVHANRTAA